MPSQINNRIVYRHEDEIKSQIDGLKNDFQSAFWDCDLEILNQNYQDMCYCFDKRKWLITHTILNSGNNFENYKKWYEILKTELRDNDGLILELDRILTRIGELENGEIVMELNDCDMIRLSEHVTNEQCTIFINPLAIAKIVPDEDDNNFTEIIFSGDVVSAKIRNVYLDEFMRLVKIAK